MNTLTNKVLQDGIYVPDKLQFYWLENDLVRFAGCERFYTRAYKDYVEIPYIRRILIEPSSRVKYYYVPCSYRGLPVLCL